MGVFGRVRLNKKRSERTHEKMRDFFMDVCDDTVEYELLYAYRAGTSDVNSGYKGMVVAFRDYDMSLVLIDTDKRFVYGDGIRKYHPEDMKRVKKTAGGEYKLYLENDIFSPTDGFEIRDVYDDEEIFPYMDQSAEVARFDEFFELFKSKVV